MIVHTVRLETRYGRLASTGPEDVIGRFLERCGEWAWDEASFVASALPEGARMLDIGAFLGTFGLGVALRKPLGFLCFVEANPMILPLLKENVENNITVPATVLGALVTGQTAMSVAGNVDPLNLGQTSFADEVPDGESTEPPACLMTLAEIRAEHGPFDAIKLDVEGMEEEILRADAQHLAQGETTLWIECNEHTRSVDVAEMLLSWGLEVHYFAFPSHNPDNFRGEETPIFPWAYEAGLLVAPKTLPTLDAELTRHQCILRRIKSVEDLKDALWQTPRWLPAELAFADAPRLAAAASHAMQGQSRELFLATGVDHGIESPKQTVWERLSATESGLARAEALAFERLDQLQQERVRRETAEQRLAEAAALALERLGEIGIERERADTAKTLMEAARASAALAAEEADVRASMMEQRLAEIDRAVLLRMAARANVFITRRPLLHGALRHARRIRRIFVSK